MAGYRITFDGSLNERKDVPQVTAGNSLTAVTSLAPDSAWEGNSAFGAGTTPYLGGVDLFSPIPATAGFAIYNTFAGAPSQPFTQSVGGGLNIITGVANNINIGFGNNGYGVGLSTPAYTGTYTVEAGMIFPIAYGGSQQLQIFKVPAGGGTKVSIGSLSGAPFDTLLTTSFSIGLANEFIWFEINNLSQGPIMPTIDYLRILQGGPVSITPSTPTQGIAPTGGVATVASPSTIIDGQSAIAGAPKLFGAKVVHDSIDVLSSKYLPPATVSQDAEAKVSKEKYITATSTSISVEGEGLGGADKLGAGRTSIVVENVPGTVEN